jgi:signal transduction histidine kinase
MYAGILGEYYSENKKWDGIQSFLSEIPRLVYNQLDRRIHGRQAQHQASAYGFDTISALLSDRITVIDLSGVVVADTAGKLLDTIHPPRHVSHGVPIIVNNAQKGTVLVGSMIDSSLTGINGQFLERIMISLLWATVFSAIIAFVLGLLFTASITRPLVSLTSAVRRVASGDLTVAVRVAGSDELSELSVSFNTMTEELNRLEQAKKQIIADSAHELRTPLTLIQGSIEAMIDGVFPLDIPTLENVHEETLRLSRLVDMLRELERIESGELALSFTDVDLGDLARKAVALFSSSAREKKLALLIAGDRPAPALIRADYVRLGEVVYNLIDNAIKYTPEGGTVRLSFPLQDGAGESVIRIDDSGPGVPSEERVRVFERFYRIDKSRATDRGGRGLGLAISGEIVKAHGGTIEVADSDLGGAAFIVRIPFFKNDC